MYSPFRLLLLLALVSISMPQIAYSEACSGSISQYVPAVMGESGGLVKVTETMAPGSGNVFVTINPHIGLATQDSLDLAVAYAELMAGQRNQTCDAFFSFDASQGTDLIDGPSAGAALTTMTYALLENRTMRNDTIMTGTIEVDGSIGAVGGLYEKAKGSAAKGAKYFIVPSEDIFELLLLKGVQKENNITVLQADDMEQVVGFMLDNKSIEQKGIVTKEAPIPDPPQYDDSDIALFRPVARFMMDLEKNSSDHLSGSSNDVDVNAIRSFYENENLVQERLFSRGYLFSAANSAFLDYIDITTIQAVLNNDADLARKKGELGICLTGLKYPQMDESNMEWMIGANLREAWAMDKYNSTDPEKEALKEQKFVEYRDLMNGVAWCDVGKALIASAPSGGSKVDQGVWRNIAEARLKEAGALVQDPTKDTFARLSIAQDSFSNGDYGAAIYDAVYVREMETADKESAQSGFNSTERIVIMLSQKRTSVWGKIYQTQGSYLAFMNQTTSAYRILRFASALDAENTEMRDALKNSVAQNGGTITIGGSSDDTAAGNKADTSALLLSIGIGALAIILIIGGIILVTRGSNGDNSTRHRKAYRAGKKES